MSQKPDKQLLVTLPYDLHKALKLAAASRETTIRALIMDYAKLLKDAQQGT